jgi:VWFA-related protein
MTKQNHQSVSMQRRKVNCSNQESTAAQHRSLNRAPRRLLFAPFHRGSLLLLACFIISMTVAPVVAQEVADTIKVNTRVVFLDTLVKDKRTGVPISDLMPENFEVLDDGKPRSISYFTREGEARKPLALVLVLDLREDGAGRFLKRPEILEIMAAELAKLSPEDEVAIMAINFNEDETRKILTDFTCDRARIAAALKQVPALIKSDEDGVGAAIANAERDKVTLGDESSTPQPPVEAPDPPKVVSDVQINQDVVSVETYKDPKSGATITRTLMKDGTVATRRTSKNGNVEVDMGSEYSLYAAAREVTRITATQRPNSRAAIVWVTDGIIPIIIEDRSATEELLIRSNVTFNSLTVSMRTLYRFLLPFAKPVGNWIGMSFAGSAKYVAKQTGGEVVQVSRTSDYARGLSRIIGNLTSRYSLGFSLAEEEADDGRLHNLEVTVIAKDAKGKKRKLEVNTRRGYYMSPTIEKTASGKPVTAQ